MKINVGSLRDAKINPVKEIIKHYDFLKDAKVIGIDSKSEVSDQPMTLQETIQGAINRAKNSYDDCNLSIGLESGLLEVPHSKTGLMNIFVCAIFDGKKIHLGLSSAFEYPIKVTEMLKKGIEARDAYKIAGLCDDSHRLEKVGAIGLLTKNRMTREDLAKQALTNALIHLENEGLY